MICTLDYGCAACGHHRHWLKRWGHGLLQLECVECGCPTTRPDPLGADDD